VVGPEFATPEEAGVAAGGEGFGFGRKVDMRRSIRVFKAVVRGWALRAKRFPPEAGRAWIRPLRGLAGPAEYVGKDEQDEQGRLIFSLFSLRSGPSKVPTTIGLAPPELDILPAALGWGAFKLQPSPFQTSRALDNPRPPRLRFRSPAPVPAPGPGPGPGLRWQSLSILRSSHFKSLRLSPHSSPSFS